MRRRVFALVLCFPLILGSCSTKYDARQGYSKYKEGFNTQIETVQKVEGISNIDVSFGSCRYVFVKSSEDSSSNSIYFYEATVFTSISGVSSISEVNYFSWTKGDKFTCGSSKEIFEYFYTSVSNELIAGECGSL